MANTYNVGEKVKITGTFTHENDPADPAIIRVIYKNPDGVVTTITYPDERIVKVDVGIYFFELAINDPGFWFYRMDDGSENVAAENQFVVKVSNVI